MIKVRKIEIGLILIIVVFALLKETIGSINIGLRELESFSLLIKLFAMSILCFTYLISSKQILVRAFLVMYSLVFIGAIFKVQHWPGAGPMLIIGLSSVLVAVIIFLKLAIDLIEQNKKVALIFLTLSILLIAQITLTFFYNNIHLLKMIHFPFLMVAIIIYQFKFEYKSKSLLVMNVLCLQSLLTIISMTFDVFNNS